MQSEQKMMKSSKLPIQAAPVERTVIGASMSSDNGVDPSLWTALASTLIPVAAEALSSLIG
ncbi:hypothetical protein [Moorena sp. SIO4G3]|uniref:hypothetical protein n=1 Tax=Moorena sp. SIO4G3 TaxID=2607821 RepID=UPI001429A27A|nr:hypothetical protein [Moorena sp. SIO4G3]NEO78075.1 hypothetical protein [Moorena sp. SIO4G3]